jgi:predicted  nucleic acid-binding Zn-ribbon protein
MMVSLEAAKLVAAGWLKFYWKSRQHPAPQLHAHCGRDAVAITSLGIYGYLSAGHLEQAAPRADIAVQSQPLELQVQQKNDENTRLQQRLTQIDQNIAVFLKNDQASKGLRASGTLKKERDDIQKKLDANNTAINDLERQACTAEDEVQRSRGQARSDQVSGRTAGLGRGFAVRFVILLIMSVFDPLAVVLLLSAMVTFRDYFDERKKRTVLHEGIVPEQLIEDMLFDPFLNEVSDDEVIDGGESSGENAVDVDLDSLAGFDVIPYDSAPLDDSIGSQLEPLKTEPPKEGTRFNPDNFTFSVGPVTPSSSYRSFDGFFDWYRQKPPGTTDAPKKEEPTFKVLALPELEAQPTGILEPEERTDYDLEGLEDTHLDNEDYMPAMAELESRVETQQADIDELSARLDSTRSEKDSLQAAYNAVSETLAKLSEQHRDAKLAAFAEQERLGAELKSQTDLQAELEAEREAHDNLRDTYVSLLGEMSKMSETNNALKEKLEAPATKEVDRDTLIAILERHPGILNEIEDIVEHDVVEEMSDREKLLDLLEKNPMVINDMAQIIASQIKGPSGPGWLDR